MSEAARSFCQLDLTPVLEDTATASWTLALREHTSRCACCALRLGAIERLQVHMRAPLERPTAVMNHSRRRRRSGKLVRVVLGPVERTAALAAMALVAAFLALAVGRGVGMASQTMLRIPGGLHSDGPTIVVAARAAESNARLLAGSGSPFPLSLMPPVQ